MNAFYDRLEWCASPPGHAAARPLKIREEADAFSMDLGATEKNSIVRVLEVRRAKTRRSCCCFIVVVVATAVVVVVQSGVGFGGFSKLKLCLLVA